MQKKMECKAHRPTRRISVVRRTTKREPCAIVCTEHHFPFEGTGGVYWDGEDFIKTSNAAIRFLCAPIWHCYCVTETSFCTYLNAICNKLLIYISLDCVV